MPSIDFLPGEPLTVAITALGGQGGGVLSDWIVDLAEHAGWIAQSTSVPGVAQRTGATVYYIELFPPAPAGDERPAPVLALMAAPGQVDLVIAAELMEAGRAVQRGLVTPERTTLVASSHRSYAVLEKIAPGNGIADAQAVLTACAESARRFVAADMARIAEDQGSVISASLFGAVAASEALPFGREAFEETIRRAGVGVEASLRAFGAGYEAAQASVAVEPAAIEPAAVVESTSVPTDPRVARLLERVRGDFDPAVQSMLRTGLRRVLEYQDEAYGDEYLDRVHTLYRIDREAGGAARGWALSIEAARHIARAMAYDDVIRVADLKTRASRFERVRSELGAKDGQLLATTEYFHPRLEEFCGTLPASLGLWLESSPRLSRWLGRRLDRGRRIRTTSMSGFLMLYGVAGMRRMRRRTLRHQREAEHMARWLERVHACAPRDYALAVEVLRCRRLVKGYSDTHARGHGKFDRLMAAADRLLGQADAGAALARLREAALADPAGASLDARLGELGLEPRPAA